MRKGLSQVLALILVSIIWMGLLPVVSLANVEKITFTVGGMS